MIDIPAGQRDYAVSDTYVLPVDVDVRSVYPHAHYLAREMKGFATLPDGTVKWLLWIKAWDFKWQDQYRFTTPVFLPRGTTLTMHFTYDNSVGNARNPHSPPQRVVNGPRSSDEMAVLWLEILPRNSANTGILRRDFVQREMLADVAGAERRAWSQPGNASLRTFLATKYLRVGRTREALAKLEEAIRLDPGDAEARNNLGNTLQLLGRTGEAIRHLLEASRLKPDDARVHFNLGNAMAADGRTDEATREYRRAIEPDPRDADAHYNLAGVLHTQQKIDEAIAHLRQALAIDP